MTTTQLTAQTKTKADTDLSSLVSYIDKLSLELYNEKEWESARGLDSLLGMVDANLMMEEVIDTAFQRSPELFNNVRWFNDENGMPIWVRPGIEWEIENLDPDND